MGCLNSEGQFAHWFGNIHLSGPCNRSCYFCIGQHMMALDALNVLDNPNLPGFEDFMTEIRKRDIKEVNLTGSNTDPLLYNYCARLIYELKQRGVETIGVRTNAASHIEKLQWFDKISVSMHSFDPEIYRAMMGSGSPPNLLKIVELGKPVKLNIVMGPENVARGDILATIYLAQKCGIRKINVREPYGQPHIGDPFPRWGFSPEGHHLGMPYYNFNGVRVTYWDVHYVEVESVNLYANGRVSITYPVTKGCAADGTVEGQEHFEHSGRVREQWVGS